MEFRFRAFRISCIIITKAVQKKDERLRKLIERKKEIDGTRAAL